MKESKNYTQFLEAVVMKAVERERRRCVGIVLADYGVWRLSGEERIAAILDGLATKLEHPESELEPSNAGLPLD